MGDEVKTFCRCCSSRHAEFLGQLLHAVLQSDVMKVNGGSVPTLLALSTTRMLYNSRRRLEGEQYD
jgi:hypothetical protein